MFILQSTQKNASCRVGLGCCSKAGICLFHLELFGLTDLAHDFGAKKGGIEIQDGKLIYTLEDLDNTMVSEFQKRLPGMEPNCTLKELMQMKKNDDSLITPRMRDRVSSLQKGTSFFSKCQHWCVFHEPKEVLIHNIHRIFSRRTITVSLTINILMCIVLNKILTFYVNYP